MITLQDWNEYLAIIINNDATNRLSIGNKYSILKVSGCVKRYLTIPTILSRANAGVDDLTSSTPFG